MRGKKGPGSFSLVVLALAVAATVGISLSQRAGADGVHPIAEAARQITTSSDPARLFENPQAAVDPTNPERVAVAVGDVRNGGCMLYISNDGGLTFAKSGATLLPSDQQFCGQVQGNRYISPSFAGDGSLYVAMSGASLTTGYPNAPEIPLVARSADAGATTATATVATPEAVTTANGTVKQDYRYTDVAVDPSNPKRLYAGWQVGVTTPSNGKRSGLPPTQAVIAASSDGGATWSMSQVSMTASGMSLYGAGVPSLVVASDGAVYAVVKEVPKPAASGPPPPARFIMFASTDHGAHWAASEVPDQAGKAFVEPPVIAADPKGAALYVAWNQDATTPTEKSTIYFTSSTDKGKTWSQPFHLVDANARSIADSYEAGMSVAPDGRIDVTWNDFRNDLDHHTSVFASGMTVAPNSTVERFYDIYGTSSSDGGRTWTPNYRVSDRSIDGLYGGTYYYRLFGPIGMASTDHALYVTWADSRNSKDVGAVDDAYFTRVEMDSSAVGQAASGPTAADALWAGVGAGGILCIAGLLLLLVSLRRRSAE